MDFGGGLYGFTGWGRTVSGHRSGTGSGVEFAWESDDFRWRTLRWCFWTLVLLAVLAVGVGAVL